MIIKHILILALITLSSNLFAQDELVLEYAKYEYNSQRLNTTEDIEVYEYFRIYSNGKLVIINLDGDEMKLELSPTIVTQLKGALPETISSYRNAEKPRNNQFYGGKYLYLNTSEGKVCTSPYKFSTELDDVLAIILDEIAMASAYTETVVIALKESDLNTIKTTHNKSNLAVIANPPPAMRD